jgi:ATP-dependent helicase/nuclease subunit A
MSHSASDPRISVWVSASAGSGKTKLLVDRFLRIVLTGVPFKKILCITFTSVAAKEMISRIGAELESWSIASQEELRAKLSSLTGSEPEIELLSSARQLFIKYLDEQTLLKIQTVHSFCQSIMHQFALEAGVEAATVMTDYERQLLIEKAKNSMLTECSDPEIGCLLSDIHEVTFSKLIEQALFLNSVGSFSSKDEQQEYIDKLKQVLSIDAIDEIDLLGNPTAVGDLCVGPVLGSSRISGYTPVLRSGPPTNPLTSAGYARGLMEFLNKFNAVLSDGFDDLQGLSDIPIVSQLLSMEREVDVISVKTSFLTKEGTMRKVLLNKAQRSQYPGAFRVLEELQLLVYDYHEKLKSIEILKHSLGFLSLACEFSSKFAQVKKSSNALDYDDLIELCLKLFNSQELGQWIKYKLSNQISHILVDEAQDISLKQWAVILGCVGEFFSEAKTVFVVGDPKQSIYSFQGASPQIFGYMQSLIAGMAELAGSKLWLSHLSESYRSDKRILEFVDRTFACVHEIDPRYATPLKHTSNLTFAGASVEVWPLIVESEINPAKALAGKLAERARQALQEGGLEPGDIMILVRKRDELMDCIVQAFKSLNIPVNGIDRLDLSEHLVTKDLAALMKFLLLTSDDYSLACVLKSPIIGLIEEDLFLLCQRGDQTLWDSLCSKNTLNQSLQKAWSVLSSMLEKKHEFSPYKLVSYVFDHLGLRTEFLASFGLYINDIIDELLNVALEFEERSESLQQFVHFLETTELDVKINLDNSRDEVKVMTIHASKGLQAKLVILPDTTSIPRNKGGVLIDVDSRLALYAGNSDNKNAVYQDVHDGLYLKMMQEYYRLLYVALTRASHQLVICGWSNNEKVDDRCWYKVLAHAHNFTLCDTR